MTETSTIHKDRRLYAGKGNDTRNSGVLDYSMEGSHDMMQSWIDGAK